MEFWIPIDKLTTFQIMQDRRREMEHKTVNIITEEKEKVNSPYFLQTDIEHQLVQDQPPALDIWLSELPDGKTNFVSNLTSIHQPADDFKALLAARLKTDTLPKRIEYASGTKTETDKYAHRRKLYEAKNSHNAQSTTKHSQKTKTKKHRKSRDRTKRYKVKLPGNVI